MAKNFKQFVLNNSIVVPASRADRIESISMKRAKLSDHVMDYVVKRISSGEYPPESRIDPKEIARKLDISQMPVRDALERLEQLGWIVKYPQRGTFIKKVSYNDLREIQQIRTMIETESIIDIVSKYDPVVISELEEITAKNEVAIMNDDLENYEKYDTRFHHHIVSSSANQRMLSLFRTVMSQIRYYFLVLIWNSDTIRKHEIMNLKNIPISHKCIFEAIKQRDASQATELMRTHLSKGVERTWQMAKMQKLANDNSNNTDDDSETKLDFV
jgi:DNA-binding GntR family transcriptional regulator